MGEFTCESESDSISEGRTPSPTEKSKAEGACLVFSGLKTINSQMFEGRREGERGKQKRLHKEGWRALQHYREHSNATDSAG